MTLRGLLSAQPTIHEEPDERTRVRSVSWWEMRLAQERTCVHCGAATLFYPTDPTGDWYRCGRCGRFA